MPVVIGWDVETSKIEAGCLTPELVVSTFAGGPDTLALANGAEVSTPLHVPASDWYFNVSEAADWSLALSPDATLDFLVTVLLALEEGTVDVLVAHNGSYDWGVLVNRHPELLPLITKFIEEGKIVDTMVREQLICIAEDNFKFDDRRNNTKTRFGLDYLVMTYFRVDISGDKKAKPGEPEPWRLRYGELIGVPLDEWPAKALSYAIQDAVWARRVYLEQCRPKTTAVGPYVRPDGTAVNEREQTAAAWALHLMACHGVYTDEPMVKEFEREVTIAAKKANKAAAAAGFWKINKCKTCEGTGMVAPELTRSGTWYACNICNGQDHDTCVAQGVYKFRGKKPHTAGKLMKRMHALIDEAFGGYAEKTPTGKVKADNDTLLGSEHALLVEFAEGSQALKLLSTYLPILQRGIHRAITSSPNVLVRTGRTSWRDPNFQNPPRFGTFRKSFVPRAGKVFSSIDYNGLEMATLAQVCLDLFGFSKMAEAINAGKDLHTMFAGMMLAKEGMVKTYEEWRAILADATHELYKTIKTQRQRAKAGNFGFPGGLGVAAFVKYAKGYGAKLTFNEAEDLRNAWFELWPEMVQYFEMMSSLTSGPGKRCTIQQPGSNRIRGGCSYTSGANTWFQGLAADGAKAAMWVLYKACYLGELPDYMAGEECHLTGVRMWAFIHDEFLFEGDEGTAHLWAPQASRIMVAEMRRYTPDVAQGAPPALMRRWEKDADEVYNEDGDLVPWEE